MSLYTPSTSLEDAVRRTLVVDALRRTAFVGMVALAIGAIYYGTGQLTPGHWVEDVSPSELPALILFMFVAIGAFVGHYGILSEARQGKPVHLSSPIELLRNAGKWLVSLARPLGTCLLWGLGIGAAIFLVVCMAQVGLFKGVFWVLYLLARMGGSSCKKSRP